MIWKIWDKTSNGKPQEDQAWWTELQDRFMDAYHEAEKDGSLGRGGVARRLGIMPGSTVVLSPEHADMAKRQAEARKMTYSDYVRMLVVQALEAREP